MVFHQHHVQNPEWVLNAENRAVAPRSSEHHDPAEAPFRGNEPRSRVRAGRRRRTLVGAAGLYQLHRAVLRGELTLRFLVLLRLFVLHCKVFCMSSLRFSARFFRTGCPAGCSCSVLIAFWVHPIRNGCQCVSRITLLSYASERVEEKNRNKSPQDLKLSQSRVTLHGWSLIIRSIMPKSCYERSLFIIKQQDFQQTEENTVSARFKPSPKLFALGSHPFYRAPTPPLSFVEYLHRIPVGCSALLTSALLQYYNSGTFRNAHSVRDTM